MDDSSEILEPLSNYRNILTRTVTIGWRVFSVLFFLLSPPPPPRFFPTVFQITGIALLRIFAYKLATVTITEIILVSIFHARKKLRSLTPVSHTAGA